MSTKTFYYRLRKLREATIKQELHEIVPVIDSVEETKAPTDNTGVIRISGCELPQDISPELLTVLVKELSSC